MFTISDRFNKVQVYYKVHTIIHKQITFALLMLLQFTKKLYNSCCFSHFQKDLSPFHFQFVFDE